MRVVLSGITQALDRIVADGAFHLNNERKRVALGSGADKRACWVLSLVLLRSERIIVAVVACIALAFGVDATRKLSVDVFPDVTNVQVQVADGGSWPVARRSGTYGHSARRDRYDRPSSDESRCGRRTSLGCRSSPWSSPTTRRSTSRASWLRKDWPTFALVCPRASSRFSGRSRRR